MQLFKVHVSNVMLYQFKVLKKVTQSKFLYHLIFLS